MHSHKIQDNTIQKINTTMLFLILIDKTTEISYVKQLNLYNI